MHGIRTRWKTYDVAAYMLQEARVRRRVVIHTDHCRPNGVAELVEFLDVAWVEWRRRLNKHSSIEATTPKEYRDLDVGVLKEDSFY